MIPRRKPLPRPSKPIKRSRIKRHARKPSETVRIYGPPDRREWVKRQRCWYGVEFSSMHCAGETVNAHTETGGTGRKADADTIIPLCASHHELYDNHDSPFDTAQMRTYAKSAAKFYQRQWQERAA